MTENVSLNYNNQSTENVVQISISKDWANASAQIKVEDVEWLQEAIDLAITEARKKITAL